MHAKLRQNTALGFVSRIEFQTNAPALSKQSNLSVNSGQLRATALYAERTGRERFSETCRQKVSWSLRKHSPVEMKDRPT